MNMSSLLPLFIQMSGPDFVQNSLSFQMYLKIPLWILGMQIYMTNVCYLLPLLIFYQVLVLLVLKQEQMRKKIIRKC